MRESVHGGIQAMIEAERRGAVADAPCPACQSVFIERLHEEFKRRITTQTVPPSAESAAMMF